MAPAAVQRASHTPTSCHPPTQGPRPQSRHSRRRCRCAAAPPAAADGHRGSVSRCCLVQLSNMAAGDGPAWPEQLAMAGSWPRDANHTCQPAPHARHRSPILARSAARGAPPLLPTLEGEDQGTTLAEASGEEERLRIRNSSWSAEHFSSSSWVITPSATYAWMLACRRGQHGPAQGVRVAWMHARSGLGRAAGQRGKNRACGAAGQSACTRPQRPGCGGGVPGGRRRRRACVHGACAPAAHLLRGGVWAKALADQELELVGRAGHRLVGGDDALRHQPFQQRAAALLQGRDRGHDLRAGQAGGRAHGGSEGRGRTTSGDGACGGEPSLGGRPSKATPGRLGLLETEPGLAAAAGVPFCRQSLNTTTACWGAAPARRAPIAMRCHRATRKPAAPGRGAARLT